VVRGEAKRLTFDAAGLDELEVAGPGVAKWRREGSQVVIEPKAPVKGLFSVSIRGRAPLGKGERAVPGPQPAGVQRVDRYVTMARSDEGELIPVAMPTSVPLGQLPAWAKNLGDGVPLVAWRGPQAVRVLNGDFEGMQGPDTMVTQARFTVAAAREGRVALRMNLRVRNERRQYLHVAALPGWRPIVVRVGNQPVSGLGDGAGGLYIPLEKSVETVKGLLSFPVDVEWVGTDLGAWERRGEMTLTLPAIDAPIQAAAWEVHLPRGFRALRAPTSGQGTVLLGDLRGGGELEDQSGHAEEERRKQEVVSSALQNAVTAYKGNDWSTAQRWLDEAKNVDSGNEDAQLLQENLDVIEGRSTRNDLGARRVKDLARAKSSGLESQQADVEKTAETLYRSGDLDAAEAAWEQALQVANELTKVQQVEDVEQKTRASTASKKLADIRDAKQKRGGSASFSGAIVTVTESTTTLADGDTAWDDEEDDVSRTDGGVVGGVVGGVLFGAGVPSADEPSAGADAGIGGLIGGLGTRGSGTGGGGNAEGLGKLGTKGLGGGRGAGDAEDVDETVAMEVEEEEAATTLALDKVARIPAGRSYQAAGEAAPRKEVAAKADRARVAEKAEAKPEEKKKAKDEAPPEPSPVTVSGTPGTAAGPMAKAPPVARPAAAPKPAPPAPAASAPPATMAREAPPPPPPPAPPSPQTGHAGKMADADVDDDAGAYFDGIDISGEGEGYGSGRGVGRGAAGVAAVLADPVPADRLEALGYVDVPPDVSDGDGLRGEPPPAQAGLPRPRPPPERRKPLQVDASPMALALPLDGPTVTTTQALLPAGEQPTFTFRYRQLPSENDR